MKPILFNTKMARAILDGRKTVTRRVVKPQPEGKPFPMPPGSCYPGCFGTMGSNRVFRPPYRPGDILYVRETWAIIGTDGTHHKYGYKADNEHLVPLWHPSIHMPKEAARLFLRVTGVRVERLRPMGLDDFEAEGLSTVTGLFAATEQWADLWDSTIRKADLTSYGWSANPWVWVIEFEQISKEEAVKVGEFDA